MPLFGGSSRTPEQFWEDYRKWEEAVTDNFLNRSNVEADIARSTIKTATNNAVMLNALSYSDRKILMRNFQDTVLRMGSFMGPDVFEPSGPGGGGVVVGRLKVGAQERIDDPLKYVMSQFSIQQEADGGYKIGANIPRYEHLKRRFEEGIPQVKAGQSVFVFDTETLGLATDEAAVREVSGAMMRRESNGSFVFASRQTEHFEVARSAYGSIYDRANNRLIRMDDYVRTLNRTGRAAVPAGGDQFVDQLMPVVKSMNQADFIAGHNVSFDIDQILLNLTKTSKYRKDSAIKAEVDTAIQKVQRGEVIDTHSMVKAHFGSELPVARELLARGEPRAYSLENVMLQTNLSRLMDEEGLLDPLISGGQHVAEHDVTITGKLLQYMQEGRLEQHTLGATERELALKRVILRSYAPTPVSNIADVSHISPGMFEKLYAEGEDSLQIFRLRDSAKVADAGKKTAAEWYEELTRADSDFFAKTKITPLEQHIDATRRILPSADVEAQEMINSLGMWKRYSGYDKPYEGLLNKFHTLFKRAEIPSDETFAAFQESMAKAGMPFAGLSYEERVLTGAFSAAGRRSADLVNRLTGTSEGALLNYGEDLGVSRFLSRSHFNITKSKVVAMPLEAILRAEGEDIIPKAFTGSMGPMLGFSTVNHAEGGFVNVTHTVHNASTMLDWMHEKISASELDETGKLLRDTWKLDVEKISEMRGLIDDSGALAVNVAHISGQGGKMAFAAMNDMFQNLTRDTDKIPMRAAYMGLENGVLSVGAVKLDRFEDEAAEAAYHADVSKARTKSADLLGLFSDKKNQIKAATVYKTGSPELAQRAENIAEHLRTKGPVALVGAAVGLGTAYIYHKRKKQNEYDETREIQGYENQRDYDRYRHEMGLAPASARRSEDPLLYAGVVGNLHNSAVGHTNMSSQKHMGLFSGV